MKKYSNKKGYYELKNSRKYMGGEDITHLHHKSLLERQTMKICDLSPTVVEWQYEPFSIKYMNASDKLLHRYIPDFLLVLNNGETHLIEVKSKKETKKPKVRLTKKRKNPTKGFLTEAAIYSKNISKWRAARAFCEKHNWHFSIWTEKEIRRMLRS